MDRNSGTCSHKDLQNFQAAPVWVEVVWEGKQLDIGGGRRGGDWSRKQRMKKEGKGEGVLADFAENVLKEELSKSLHRSAPYTYRAPQCHVCVTYLSRSFLDSYSPRCGSSPGFRSCSFTLSKHEFTPEPGPKQLFNLNQGRALACSVSGLM